MDLVRDRSLRWRIVAGIALLVGGAACGDEAPGTDVPTLDADGLVTVLHDRLPPSVEGQEPLPVVFVLSLGDPVDLETQALVIEQLETTHDVRFVDDLVAAVDEDDPIVPASDAGVVIGIGTIAPEPPHLLRIERYADADDVTAELVTLVPRGDGWVVTASESVPAEELHYEP